MGVVLWSILDLEGMRDGLEKKRTRKRKVRRSEQGKRRRGFKPDAAAGSTEKPERNHIRLRGVGLHQYRKSADFPQAGPALELLALSLPQTASPPPGSQSRSLE